MRLDPKKNWVSNVLTFVLKTNINLVDCQYTHYLENLISGILLARPFPDDRQVFMYAARYYQQKSLDEIASSFGLTKRQVITAIDRAHQYIWCKLITAVQSAKVEDPEYADIELTVIGVHIEDALSYAANEIYTVGEYQKDLRKTSKYSYYDPAICILLEYYAETGKRGGESCVSLVL